MKKMMLLSLLLLVSFVKADQPTDINVVTYTVKVSRDQEAYDKEQWNKIIQEVVKAIEKGNAANADDMVTAFVRGIETIYKESGSNGIHGEMTIAMSDGSKPCCGDNCRCITRGACPCTDEVNCAQK